MVFNFRLVSDEIENFKREIQISSEATCYDLKEAICESVGYDKNEMCSFFLCDKGWEKEKEITVEDMGTDSDVDAYIMDECVLSDYIDDEGQRLMFTYDYLNDRSFFLEMREMIRASSTRAATRRLLPSRQRGTTSTIPCWTRRATTPTNSTRTVSRNSLSTIKLPQT